ncbi:XRE family transcriptional regulator, partial [Mycobacterium tuberculosis]|nr:XRE family transcriptional regulator [Mycobacterium tuberculosis]
VRLGHLCEVERGQEGASSELLAAICDALDVEIADLLLDVGTAMRPAEADAEAMALAGESGLGSTKVVIPSPDAHRATALAAA